MYITFHRQKSAKEVPTTSPSRCRQASAWAQRQGEATLLAQVTHYTCLLQACGVIAQELVRCEQNLIPGPT